MNESKSSQIRAYSKILQVTRTLCGALCGILFLGLLSTATTPALAQVYCLAQCEQDYSVCLQQSGHDPILDDSCESGYMSCVDDCLSTSFSILGD
jgi:hypothetical protein